MAEAQVKEHELHIYRRSKYNKEVYMCTHPRCTHYHKKDFLEGKAAECPKCHKPFFLSKDQLRNKYPVCLGCSRSPKAAMAQIAESSIHDILQEAGIISLESMEKTITTKNETGIEVSEEVLDFFTDDEDSDEDDED